MSNSKNRSNQKKLKKGIETQESTLGRKRDKSRDADIMFATLDVLAEAGYNGMTMDMVALKAKAGKATLYRRWASKEDLVLDAVKLLKESQVDLESLPETGTLRGDLVALIKFKSLEEAEGKLKVIAGLTSMLSQSAKLADAVSSAIVEPWIEVHKILLKRAIEREEIPETIDIELIAKIVPSMVAYYLIILRKPIDDKLLISMIDGVLLPTVGIKSI